jgi:hypothetical protein
MAAYYVWSGATGTGTGASWANAYTTLTLAFASKSAGDVFYVAHDHSESSATTLNLSPPGTIANPSKIICVNRAGSVPPVSADRRATAQVATTGNITMTVNNAAFAHYDGIIFTAGNSTGTASISLVNAATCWTRLDNCSLRLGGTGASSRISVGTTASYAELYNTTVSFGAVGQSITINGALKWRNTPSALLGTMPTFLFSPGNTVGGEVECIGVDLSALGSGKTICASNTGAMAQKHRFIDCKLDAAVTKSVAVSGHGTNEVDFIRTGASGVNYAISSIRVSGTLTEETTIVRTGGASDGTTPISWKIVTTANCLYSIPFECPPIAIWNDVVGSPVTATVEGIWGGGAVPLDNEIWLDVEYLGSGSSPQGSFVNDGMADLLATAANQTSSSETWGGSTTKFKLAVTFTPQQKGWIYARVKCAKAGTTFYIDPLCVLS